MNFLLFILFAILSALTFKGMDKLLNCNDDKLIAKYDFWAIILFLACVVLAFVFGVRTFGPSIVSLFKNG